MHTLLRFSLLFRLIAFTCFVSTAWVNGQACHATIEDPYRWLEDTEDSATIGWLKLQKDHFDSYMSNLSHRDDYRKNIREIMNMEVSSLPICKDGKYFFLRKQPHEEQASLYLQSGSNAEPELLVNPQDFSQNGPAFLQGFNLSPDGNFVAYALSESGSDWMNWKVLDLKTKRNLADSLQKIKFTFLVWDSNSQGFYYTGYDDRSLHGVYYHALGQPQGEDKLIYQNPEIPGMFYTPFGSSDGRYLLVYFRQIPAAAHGWSYLDLKDPQGTLTEILFNDGDDFHFICNKGPLFYFLTNQDAPLRKLIAMDISRSNAITEIVAEGDHLIDQIIPIGDSFLISYAENVQSKLVLVDNQGKKIRNIPIPEFGSIHLACGDSREKNDPQCFFSFTNFVQPSMVYRYKLHSDTLEIFSRPESNFDSANYEIRQIFYPSKDGTLVPMFIIQKKGLEYNSNNKTMLYGYGGFNIGLFPFFSAMHLAWINAGNVVAVANIRGGSEFGEKWHLGGMKANKQNCFDDFIAAGEWLISNAYTQPSKLAIRGGSNGGLLVAACINQRPDLFGAAIVSVGVLDMLRYHLFTVGNRWIKEYGDPDDPEDFKILLKYSPYHNIRQGTKYPATLVTTGDHDDRVVPLHSYKYTAALQEAQAGDKPVLLRVDTQAGHGMGKPASKIIDEAADVLSFLEHNL